MADNSVLYAAVYDEADAALADLDAFERLHNAEIIGKLDAAVINHADGRPHIVRRIDHPFVRVIPEWLGAGTLPRHDLHDVARSLKEPEAALIVVGDPTLDKAFEQAVTRASRTVKRDLNVAIDELSRQLIDATK